MTSRIRVVLADDHPVIRACIRRLLLQSEDIAVVGEASNGLDALQLVYDLKPDIILLDMEMPGRNGIQVAQDIIEKGLPIRVLVVSSHNDRQYILEMFRIGIAGYLIKEEVPAFIVQAVRAVANGQTGWVSSSLAASVTTMFEFDDVPALTRPLSSVDREILMMFSTGKTSEEISVKLGLKQNMIHQHLQNAVACVRDNLGHMELAQERVF